MTEMPAEPITLDVHDSTLGQDSRITDENEENHDG